MVKHSSKKRRGISRQPQKHSLLVSDDADGDESGTFLSSILGKQLEKLPKLAEKLWKSSLLLCSRWDLIPLDVDPGTGTPRLAASLWKRGIHYMMALIYLSIMSYRLWITVERFAGGHLDLVTYMCAGSFVAMFVAAGCSIGYTWAPRRLCCLINSWKSMQKVLDAEMEGQSKSVFDDKTVSVKVIFSVLLAHLAGLNASMFTLVGEIPTCVITALTRVGLLDLPDVLPRIVWRMIFFPLELLTLWPPLVAAGISGIAIMMGLGLFKVFADQVRRIKVRKVEDWEKVYHLYRVMQVYNIILMDWFKNLVTVVLLSTNCALIVLLYVTIRPSDLPFLVYIWFPVVAILLQITTAWVIYDAVVTKRSVAEVVGNLDSYRGRVRMRPEYYAVMTRRLKSLRPPTITVGEFTEMSLELPVNVWDEVLNQLLFLLSL